VSAAAAVLFAVAPGLTASQATTILEHNVDDVNAATGCAQCTLLRDARSGWGRLDIAKAIAATLAGPLPAPDRYETNDDAGTQAHTVWGKRAKLTASVDYYEDPVDVYRVALAPHEKLTAKVSGGWPGAQVKLALWKPGTRNVDEARSKDLRAAQSATPGSTQQVRFTSRGRGWYYVEVKVVSPGFGPYTLSLDKTAPKLP